VAVADGVAVGVAVGVAIAVAVGDGVAVAFGDAVATGAGVERCTVPKRAATGVTGSPSPARAAVAVVALDVELAPESLALDVLVVAVVVAGDA